MQTAKSIVKSQLVYYARIDVAGNIVTENGPAALACVLGGGSIFTITMAPNFTVPLNRRFVKLTPINALGTNAQYFEVGSADNTCLVRTWSNLGVPLDSAFQIAIERIEMMP